MKIKNGPCIIWSGNFRGSIDFLFDLFPNSIAKAEQAVVHFLKFSGLCSWTAMIIVVSISWFEM